MDRESTSTLYGALAAARLEFGPIVKDKTAKIQSDKGTYSYTFADLASVIEATAPILAKHGLVVIQEPEVTFDENGALVMMHGCIAHAGGEVHPLRPLPMPVGRPGDARAIGSAISYARRYQLSAALNIAPDADDDATPQPAQKPQERPQARATGKQAAPSSSAPSGPATPPQGRELLEQYAAGQLPRPATQATDGAEVDADVLFGEGPRGDVSAKTLRRLHALGHEVYGDEWDAKRADLVEHMTKGATNSAAGLNEDEAMKLCAGMEAKRAKMRQPDAQHANSVAVAA